MCYKIKIKKDKTIICFNWFFDGPNCKLIQNAKNHTSLHESSHIFYAGDTFVIDQCVVAGWGKESFGASGISSVLKKMKVRRPLEVKNLFLFIVRFPLWTNCHAKMSFRKTDLDQDLGCTNHFCVQEVSMEKMHALGMVGGLLCVP